MLTRSKTLKILIITTFFPPLNSIASLRPYSWAKYWSAMGHDVTVLTTEKDKDDKTNLNMSHEGFNVVEIPFPQWIKKKKREYRQSEPTKASTHAKKNWGHKLFDFLRYEKGVFQACRMPDITHFWIKKAYASILDHGPWDCVITTAGPYTTHLLGCKMKKNQLTQKWIADYRDAWSFNCTYKGIFPFNWLEPLLEKRILKHADDITTISEPFAERFSENFSHPSVHVINNGFDTEDLKILPPESIFPEDGKVRIVYTGIIYQGKSNPSPLFEAIRQINNDAKICHLLQYLEIIFVGAQSGDLEHLIEKYQIGPWVKNRGFLKREDALRMQRDAHALLFLTWNNPSFEGVLSGKLFEYLFSGTPILAIGADHLEASQQLILDAKAGKALHNVVDIRNELIDLLEKNQKLPSHADLRFLMPFTRQHQAEKLLTLIQG